MTYTLTPVITAPSRSQIDKMLRLLEQRLGPSKYKTARETCEGYANDDSETRGTVPDAVVFAESADDVVATLEVARESGVAVVPRGGGTGRAGGATVVAGGIVLSTRGMSGVRDIDRAEQMVVVGPGTILADLQREVEAAGLFYPPDPNSLSGCAIGGNVATNAGGPRAFKYGSTREYVLGLDAYLMGGQRFFAGRRTKKGVTGYDVTALIVGSEGTLAVVGDITLRLLPKPQQVMTLLLLFESIAAALDVVRQGLQTGVMPRCIEFLDGGTLQAVRQAGNPIDERAGAMLLVEFDGDAHECERDAERLADVAERGGALEVLAAQDPAQRDRLWSARREMSLAVRRMAPFKLSEDVVVPRRHVAELVARAAEGAERRGIRMLSYGHAGDGNLHVNFLWDDPSQVPEVEASVEQLFRHVVALGGTLTGEHGLGLLKAPYLHLEQAPALIALQRELKRVFDPENLLNPGKLFAAAGHGPC